MHYIYIYICIQHANSAEALRAIKKRPKNIVNFMSVYIKCTRAAQNYR